MCFPPAVILHDVPSLRPARADHAAEIDRLVQPLIDGEVTRRLRRRRHRRRPARSPRLRRDRPRRQRRDAGRRHASTKSARSPRRSPARCWPTWCNRGEVKLDEPIAELLPEGVTSPAFDGDQPITLVHLATHTSGLPRLPDNMAPKDPTNPYADYTPELMFEFLERSTSSPCAGRVRVLQLRRRPARHAAGASRGQELRGVARRADRRRRWR